jgi:hypothetical protein
MQPGEIEVYKYLSGSLGNEGLWRVYLEVDESCEE